MRAWVKCASKAVCGCWLTLGALAAPLAGHEARAQSVPNEPAMLDYHVDRNVMVSARDGVALATDLYRPARAGSAIAGKFPVLVYRTPYNKDGLRSDGIFFAEHGYVVVAQDCRGRFASGGTFGLLSHDGEDGYDTIEWAARQPWSKGKVGTAGASYEAWTQYAAAMLAPPHLAAMFPVVGWDSFYRYAFNGGVPELSMSEWILFMAQTSQEASRLPALRARLEATFKDSEPWLRLPPSKRAAIFEGLPVYQKMFQDVYSHPHFDSYWQQENIDLDKAYARFKDVPMFFISGWYDGTVGGVVRNFAQLSALQQAPKKLLIGPWPHATGKASCGEADFGAGAAVDERALELDWFNHWLKGEPYTLIDSSPVTIFEMGGGTPAQPAKGDVAPGGRWVKLRAWPHAGSSSEDLYLVPGGGLDTEPVEAMGAASYADDPANPTPTRGGYLHNECVQDQQPVERRADVVSFTTPALKRPVAVTGEVVARLWVSTSAKDTDFVVKLTDVSPNGYSMIVAEGETRMSARSGTGRIATVPGRKYPITIAMGPTSNVFVSGHRIRVDISSTDFPRLEPNPNTDVPLWQWTQSATAQNTIYLGGKYPSRVALPLLTGARSVDSAVDSRR